MEKIEEIMKIYQDTSNWDWRFGKTPEFTNNLETKLDWAWLDIYVKVVKGSIVSGQVYSDCLIPTFIDDLNELLNSGIFKYDMEGVKDLCRVLAAKNEGISTIV